VVSISDKLLFFVLATVSAIGVLIKGVVSDGDELSLNNSAFLSVSCLLKPVNSTCKCNPVRVG